jgi:two-component system sensor histidine kinase KdpD
MHEYMLMIAKNVHEPCRKADLMYSETTNPAFRESAVLTLMDAGAPLKKKLGNFLEFITRELCVASSSLAFPALNGKSLEIWFGPSTQADFIRVGIDSPCVPAAAYGLNEPYLVEKAEECEDNRQIGIEVHDSCISVPFSISGKIAGILTFAKRREGKAFTGDDLDAATNLTHYLAVFIENARRFDRLIDERNRFRKRSRELKKLVQWKDRSAQMMVHDLKSPINELVANLDLLKDERLSELGVECLETAILGCDNLTRIVNNVLDIAKIQSRKANVKLREADLAVLGRAVVDRLRPVAALNEVSLVDEWRDTPLFSEVDETLLTRAMVNILDNAIKFTPSRGIIHVVGKTEKRYHVIEFHDQGPGIPMELQQSIFRTYVQGTPSKKGAKGFGLGLAMSKMAADVHKGKISVSSVPGTGSVFRLQVPVSRNTEC